MNSSKKDNKKRVLSGIKPSGEMHIGGYIGAVKHWAADQERRENFFMIADLHTITVPQDPEVMHRRTRELVAWLVASGITLDKSHIFVQSHNSHHAELTWILNCFTGMGQLSRMTEYKDKSEKVDFVSVGLFDYPVLMAADILLYETDEVPVGDDQKQHVELCRDIVQRFNSRYGKEILKLPEPVIAEVGARVMSLQEPTKKMSKSENDPMGTVDLKDDTETIRNKIKRAVTDSGSEILYRQDKPAMSNLLQIYAELSGKKIKELEEMYVGKGYGVFKDDLAEVVVNALKPIQVKYKEIMDSGEIEKILKEGVEKARVVSGKTLKRVEEVVGLG